MNIEQNRLRTFEQWPSNAAVDAARIAKAGFYYCGHGLEVQCFLCGVKISNWNYGDQAMARHRQAQPDCPFVINSADTCNVPLIPASVNSAMIPTAPSTANPIQPTGCTSNSDKIQTIVHSSDPLRHYATFAQRLRSFVDWPIPTVVSPEQLAKAGFYYLQFRDLVECAFCKGVLAKWITGDDPDREHRLHFPNCDFYLRPQTESDALRLANVNLLPGSPTSLRELRIQTHRSPSNPMNRTYEDRLRTYDGWPSDRTQTPEVLAAAGFYFTGYQDQVRCFHCDGGLRNWEPQDDVWFEHARWFPTCTFMNLVRGHEFIKRCIANSPPIDPRILNEVPNQEGEDITETPAASSPIVTYPQSHVNNASNQENKDTVRLVTSNSTVPQPDIRSNTLRLNNLYLNDAPDEESGNIARLDPTVPQSNDHVMTNSQIIRLLDTAPVLTALEIGLPVSKIKQVLEKRMEECSIGYTSAEELIEAVLNNETEEDRGASTSSPAESITRIGRVVSRPIEDPALSILNGDNDVASGINGSSNNEIHGYEEEEMKTLDEHNELYQDEASHASSVIMLQEENRKLKEARLCKICMDNDLAIVFLPCGHLATCVICAPSLVYCPMCRMKIRASVRIFLS